MGTKKENEKGTRKVLLKRVSTNFNESANLPLETLRNTIIKFNNAAASSVTLQKQLTNSIKYSSSSANFLETNNFLDRHLASNQIIKVNDTNLTRTARHP